MKTTDLLYQNQQVLNALQEMLLTNNNQQAQRKGQQLSCPFFLSCFAVTQYKRRQTKPCISFPALLSAFRRCV